MTNEETIAPPRDHAGLAHGVLHELSSFPARLEALFALVPEGYRRWSPGSWAGVPSESLNAMEQVCHVRDIELLGYQVRVTRMLSESHPWLASLDAHALARDRHYANASPAAALTEFRAARLKTVELISSLTPQELNRTADLEGYGAVDVRGLMHYLCSHDHQHAAGLHWLLGQIAATRERPTEPCG